MRFAVVAVFGLMIPCLAQNLGGPVAAVPADPSPSPAPAPAPASTAGADTPIKIGDVTLTGSLRLRLYGWDWFQAAPGDNQYEYSGNLLRLNFAEQRKGWDWDAEFAVPFLLALPAHA